MGVYLNPGNDGFRLSVNDDIYVDKTELIAYTNHKDVNMSGITIDDNFLRVTDRNWNETYYNSLSKAKTYIGDFGKIKWVE